MQSAWTFTADPLNPLPRVLRPAGTESSASSGSSQSPQSPVQVPTPDCTALLRRHDPGHPRPAPTGPDRPRPLAILIALAIHGLEVSRRRGTRRSSARLKAFQRSAGRSVVYARCIPQPLMCMTLHSEAAPGGLAPARAGLLSRTAPPHG